MTDCEPQKAKLKVGKSKPKAANYTDTSFKAKSITLKKQSLNESAPGAGTQIAHHTSLLKNRISSQRHDSLAFLTNLSGAELSNAAPELLPKLPPLIHDESSSVRQQLLKLLRKVPEQKVLSATEQLLLWTRAGITHLSTDIQLFSLEVLEWLLSVTREDLFAIPGSWTGLLSSFVTVCGWQGNLEATAKGWSTQKQSARPGSETKILVKRLSALYALLRVGLAPSAEMEAPTPFEYNMWSHYGLPQRPNAFAHLDLFGAQANGDQQIFDNRQDRQRFFHDHFETKVQQGVRQALKEGGEFGRGSSALLKLLKTSMSAFDE